MSCVACSNLSLWVHHSLIWHYNRTCQSRRKWSSQHSQRKSCNNNAWRNRATHKYSMYSSPWKNLITLVQHLQFSRKMSCAQFQDLATFMSCKRRNALLKLHPPNLPERKQCSKRCLRYVRFKPTSTVSGEWLHRFFDSTVALFGMQNAQLTQCDLERLLGVQFICLLFPTPKPFALQRSNYCIRWRKMKL